MTAFAAAGGLICFFYALSKGDASVVVPTTSAYPVVALAGGAIFLLIAAGSLSLRWFGRLI